MRIGIDARFYQEAGIGRYIRNLIKNLATLDSKNEYFIFLLDKNFDEVTLPKNFQKVRANFGWYGLQEQIKFPKLLRSYKLDLVHFPHFNIPIFYKGRFVVTIHDLIHQNFQMKRATTLNPIIYKIKKVGYDQVFNNAINNASKILVPSNYVKDLLIEEWKLDKDRIVVTYEAVDGKIFSVEKIMKEEIIDQVMNKYSIKQPYIFYVGNAHPHKNVEGLIKAFLLLKNDYPNLKLYLAGHDHYFWQRIKQEYKDEGIVYKGYVNDRELIALYKGARVFVMPSFDEGFGLPILEAFAMGVPVVSSNSASLPEVGGDACIYFNPKDVTDMANKIKQVLDDKSLRQMLIEKGQQRYKLFSWEKLARTTLKIYEESV